MEYWIASPSPTLVVSIESVRRSIEVRRSSSPNRASRWLSVSNTANLAGAHPSTSNTPPGLSPGEVLITPTSPIGTQPQSGGAATPATSQACNSPAATTAPKPSNVRSMSTHAAPMTTVGYERDAGAESSAHLTQALDSSHIPQDGPVHPLPTPSTELTGSLEKLVVTPSIIEPSSQTAPGGASGDYFTLIGPNRGALVSVGARQSDASSPGGSTLPTASSSSELSPTSPVYDVDVDWFNDSFAKWIEVPSSNAAPIRLRQNSRMSKASRKMSSGRLQAEFAESIGDYGMGPSDADAKARTSASRALGSSGSALRKVTTLRELLGPLVSADDREHVLHLILDLVEDADLAEASGTQGIPSTSAYLASGPFTATIVGEYVVLVAPPQSFHVPKNKRLATPHFNSYQTVTAHTRLDPVASPFANTAGNQYLRLLGQTSMGRMIRDFDWSSTSIGPISSWPPELKTTLSNVLASPFRECILYGPEFIMLYNDEYVTTAQNKHPALLGQPAAIGWAELWEGLDKVAERVREGETVFVTDHFFGMFRNGVMEETYHTFSYSPFYDTDGNVLGIRNFSVETTATVIAARRLSTVRDLIQMSSLARTVNDFTDSALASLALNPYDLPFVLLYTVTPEVAGVSAKELVRAGAEDKKFHNRHRIKLTGSLGVPEDHVFRVDEIVVDLTPPTSRLSSASGSHSNTGSGSGSGSSNLTTMDTDGPRSRWSWPFEDACLRREPVFVERLGELANHLEKRGWDDSPRHAVVIPITVESTSNAPQAVLVLGVSSRSVYDDLYSTFFSLVARHIAIGLYAVLTAEIDAKRSEDLVKLDRAKTNFFSSVSHELRTPLTLILGPLDDLLASKKEIPAATTEKLQMMSRHANRLLTMVNKLLDFSSLEGGRTQAKFRPVKIGVLTQDLATLFRDAIERAGLRYVIECDDDRQELVPIYLASDLWEKVCYNLIGNALKYCRSGSIEVRLKTTVAEAVLSVKDTGVGIPSEELSSIFERFHRVEGTARTSSGTGIGLALTLEIVKLLGGLVEVESELGVGSTFYVRIPRGFTHLAREQVIHEPEEISTVPIPQGRSLGAIDDAASWHTQEESCGNSSSGGSASGSFTGSKEMSLDNEFADTARLLNLANKTVLLADDSVDLRIYISSILSKTFNVVQVADGQAALDHVLKHPPSLIITDQMMPRLTGNELVAAVRANPATSLIPIIMLSAQAGTEARAEALERGCDDYLVKPFQARELLARVNVHMQLGLLRVELEKRVQERTRALIDSETRNRALAEKFLTLSTVSPVGIMQADAEGHIVYANPRWFEMTGYPVDRLVTNAWTECLEDSRELNEAWQAAVMAGHSSEIIDFKAIEIGTKTGQTMLFEIRAFSGAKDGFVAVLTDITRQKMIEREHLQIVEQRAADAEENRRNTEMFLDLSSHEMRNPLSGVWQNAQVLSGSLEQISGVIDDLCAGRTPPQAILENVRREMQENADAVDSIILCASHQGRIADDILNVSKLNMGLLSINPVPFDLTLRMGEVLRMFEMECSQKGISLRMDVDESIAKLRASWIEADPSRLSQILLNFVSNSVKYTSDTPERRIVVHLNAYDTRPPTRRNALRVSEPSLDLVPPHNVWIVVGVEDTGKGLSQEEMKRLFARFQQVNPRSDQYGGSGLGLFISSELVALHSGYIEVESVPGQGSMFRFAIPAGTSQPPVTVDALLPPVPLTTVAMMAPPQRTKRAAPPRSSLNGDQNSSHKVARLGESAEEGELPKRILVVEDNLINQKVMTRQLKLAGYGVTVANHGREALDILLAESTRTNHHEQGPIVMVLMDIEMPVMGGLEAIRLLREMEKSGQIANRYNVVAVTGNGRPSQTDEYSRVGFDSWAVKPYIFADLLVQIKSYASVLAQIQVLTHRE
ncbi:BZ3500_MvSof-1268-A1-R1_Chr2-2g04915 [Microbotryum saponariae]|uniref:histidine kinase n=1 Tax=Microbotryum saponariae TaxID=289078 RepID=A0A2X0N6Q1_9BASI|nr:BZ3500_MvSof-1268-A1-R1_Chr2-2g04915 [Microbotryum saponariae]SDA00467.1 BZ3501_MvSof-1269-A2-R1_Chr2-2g04589 [Microbotryum saponariae]